MNPVSRDSSLSDVSDADFGSLGLISQEYSLERPAQPAPPAPVPPPTAVVIPYKEQPAPGEIDLMWVDWESTKLRMSLSKEKRRTEAERVKKELEEARQEISRLKEEKLVAEQEVKQQQQGGAGGLSPPMVPEEVIEKIKELKEGTLEVRLEADELRKKLALAEKEKKAADAQLMKRLSKGTKDSYEKEIAKLKSDLRRVRRKLVEALALKSELENSLKKEIKEKEHDVEIWRLGHELLLKRSTAEMKEKDAAARRKVRSLEREVDEMKERVEKLQRQLENEKTEHAEKQKIVLTVIKGMKLKREEAQEKVEHLQYQCQIQKEKVEQLQRQLQTEKVKVEPPENQLQVEKVEPPENQLQVEKVELPSPSEGKVEPPENQAELPKEKVEPPKIQTELPSTSKEKVEPPQNQTDLPERKVELPHIQSQLPKTGNGDQEQDGQGMMEVEDADILIISSNPSTDDWVDFDLL